MGENVEVSMKRHVIVDIISRDGELPKQEPLQKIMRFFTSPAKFKRPQNCSGCNEVIDNLPDHVLFKCRKNLSDVNIYFSTLGDQAKTAFHADPIKFMKTEVKSSEGLSKFLHFIIKLTF